MYLSKLLRNCSPAPPSISEYIIFLALCLPRTKQTLADLLQQPVNKTISFSLDEAYSLQCSFCKKPVLLVMIPRNQCKMSPTAYYGLELACMMHEGEAAGGWDWDRAEKRNRAFRVQQKPCVTDRSGWADWLLMWTAHFAEACGVVMDSPIGNIGPESWVCSGGGGGGTDTGTTIWLTKLRILQAYNRKKVE